MIGHLEKTFDDIGDKTPDRRKCRNPVFGGYRHGQVEQSHERKPRHKHMTTVVMGPSRAYLCLPKESIVCIVST